MLTSITKFVENTGIYKNQYASWNDTSVAHVFIRLITKKNHPYNDEPLSIESYLEDHALMLGYIEWKKTQPPKNFSLYNFTPESMTSFIELITHDTRNIDELWEIWKTRMMEPQSN